MVSELERLRVDKDALAQELAEAREQTKSATASAQAIVEADAAAAAADRQTALTSLTNEVGQLRRHSKTATAQLTLSHNVCTSMHLLEELKITNRHVFPETNPSLPPRNCTALTCTAQVHAGCVAMLNRTVTEVENLEVKLVSGSQRCDDVETQADIKVEKSRLWHLRLTMGLLVCTAAFLAWPVVKSGLVRC
jgi:hypothetical protein